VAQDVFGHAAAALSGWGRGVDEVPMVGKADDAGLFVEQSDVEIVGAHEGADGVMDAGVEAGEVGGGMDGFRDFEEGFLDFLGAIFLGDVVTELGIGGNEFGGAFVDTLFEFGIHRSNRGLDGFALVDLTAQHSDPGDGKQTEASRDGQNASRREGTPPGGETEDADVRGLAEDDSEATASAGSARDGGADAGDFREGVFGNPIKW